MKKVYKLIACFFTVSMLLISIPKQYEASVSVSAQSAVLMEQQSGRVLFEKDARQIRRIASITKIMTAIIAIESGKLAEKVKVSEKAVWTEGSSIYLQTGEKIKLEDLVYGLMLRSGNDAAVAIAEHVGGSLDGFVFLMNQKAEEIGMTQTHFANPHGLDDHENHYSTAYDMAVLTRYAMGNDTYQKIAGTKVHKAPNPEASWQRVWKNKNRLLTEMYDYCTGGKTGYTKRAKRTLVTTATKGDMDLISVTLDGPDDWNDHIQLFEYGFKDYDIVEILPKGKIRGIKEPQYKNSLFLKTGFEYPATDDEMKRFEVKYKLIKPSRLERGDTGTTAVAGQAAVYLDGVEIKKIPIYYQQKEKKSFFSLFKDSLASWIGVHGHG